MAKTNRAHRRLCGVALAVSVAAAGALQSTQTALGQGQGSWDSARELQMKITKPFTLAAVGDLWILRSIPVDFQDDRFQRAMKVVRDSDVGFANLEVNVVDIPKFTGPLYAFTGPKEAAASVKALGFSLVNRAMNHLTDSGVDAGVFETNELLAAVGIVHAGTGKNLEDARAARFLETPKGRIGLVGMAPQGGMAFQGMAATPRLGNVGGKPGLNPLGIRVSYSVTNEQLEMLRKIQDEQYAAGPADLNRVGDPNEPMGLQRGLPPQAKGKADHVNLFGATYKVGTPGLKTYTMNQEDLRQILLNIRNGKFYSDFMIATIHTHDAKWVGEQFPVEAETPDYLIELAHKAIDNGADVFLGHGPHAVRGIEIYKGKPIFYGLGQFIRQADFRFPNFGEYREQGADPFTTEKTPAEIMWEVRERVDRRFARNEGMIAVSRYDGGRLVEVRVYPTDGGRAYDWPLSQIGYPRMASPDVAQRILARLQRLSKEFGTTIAIEGNVGVIKVASASQTASGRRP